MERAYLLPIAAALCCATLGAQPEALVPESRRAKELMAAGRYSEAVTIYEKLVRSMPANPGLRLNFAMALHEAGEDRRAIPEFEAVLKQQPDSVPALMLLGASYLRTGNPSKAVRPLERALTLAPGDIEGRSMLVDALLMEERYEAAIPHLRKLVSVQPQNPRAWYGLGRAYEAVAQRAFEELEKPGPDTPWGLALTAEVRLKEGRNTAAFVLYRSVLEKRPDFRGAHAGLAAVYRATSHPDWAATEDEREEKLGRPACGTPTAECHFLAGRYGQALAASLPRKTAEALYWQARAANALATEAFSHLGKLPPSVESHQFMAELLRNQGRHSDAIKEWKEALRLAPNDPRLEQELATSVYMSRDYAAAEQMVRSLLARDPESAELQFVLGDSLMNQQQPEQAIGPLSKAVALRTDYEAAHAVLGRALLQVGKPAEAVPHLKRALALDTDGSLHFQLSRAYQSLGQETLAAETLAVYRRLSEASAPGGAEITPP